MMDGRREGGMMHEWMDVWTKKEEKEGGRGRMRTWVDGWMDGWVTLVILHKDNCLGRINCIF